MVIQRRQHTRNETKRDEQNDSTRQIAPAEGNFQERNKKSIAFNMTLDVMINQILK